MLAKKAAISLALLYQILSASAAALLSPAFAALTRFAAITK